MLPNLAEPKAFDALPDRVLTRPSRGKRLDLTGQTFGYLQVLKEAPLGAGGRMWWCRCACGKVKAFWQDALVRGGSKSCRCRMPKRVKHGHLLNRKATRTYKSWQGMLRRTTKKNSKDWKNYGGRGITVCRRWRRFENFLADMGERPPGTTLDRKNNSRGYTPGNCQWATRKEQNRNSRRCRILRLASISKPLWKWAEDLAVPKSRIWARLNLGWSVKRALTEPVS